MTATRQRLTSRRARHFSFLSASLGFSLGLAGMAGAQAVPTPPEKPADQGSSPAPAGTTPDVAPETRPASPEAGTAPAPSGTSTLAPLVPPATVPLVPAAPEVVPVPPPPPPPKKEEHWYDKLRIRGYTQFRYNRFPSFDENDNLINDQGDKSIGGGNGVFIRRARVILFGDVHEHVSVYLQPDFASAINTQLNVAIMRDWYADLFIDKKKEFRVRVGQSKVPFGFENLQSSQNRIPFDRNDAINSAVKDERDIGAFFYWAPAEIRGRFKHFVDAGLKGSGDYGVVGVGVYNGQTANRIERNDNRHVIARLTWPFKFGEQFLEIGAAAYYGKYNVTLANQGMVTYQLANGENDLEDTRAQATVVLYPQPIGFVAEYNFGRGPSQGTIYPNVISSRNLQGGYAQAMLKLDDVGGTTLIPYARYTYYEGGKKFEDNAPRYLVKEFEFGAEWQLFKNLEITAAYMISDRTSSKFPYAQQQGHVTRLQVQVNY
jgi:hypothetical protein